ncbi:MAG: hypothetical protein L0G18_11480, partial [Pseudomonas sp.]|nr:hypothetical protein [Pseudomonas sp.]
MDADHGFPSRVKSDRLGMLLSDRHGCYYVIGMNVIERSPCVGICTDGYESYHKTASGWKNGGGPDRFCLMPEQSESSWDIRDDLSFVHLYCTDEHLRGIGEQIWDKSPASIALDEKTFASDPKIAMLYRQFLLGCDWQQAAN